MGLRDYLSERKRGEAPSGRYQAEAAQNSCSKVYLVIPGPGRCSSASAWPGIRCWPAESNQIF